MTSHCWLGNYTHHFLSLSIVRTITGTQLYFKGSWDIQDRKYSMNTVSATVHFSAHQISLCCLFPHTKHTKLLSKRHISKSHPGFIQLTFQDLQNVQYFFHQAKCGKLLSQLPASLSPTTDIHGGILYQFPEAVVTHYHKLSELKKKTGVSSLTVLKAIKSETHLSCAPSGSSKPESVFASSSFCWLPWDSWVYGHVTPISASIFILLSPFSVISLCVIYRVCGDIQSHL